jgi:pyruvate/2-oxoglutarate dehydrogenase complex dihydrolipoamide dehydrogenase (E3) component
VLPAIPGLENVSTLNSTTIMEIDALPEHLLIIGGGYIGLEFGQMFRRFGCQVTIIQRGEQLLAREDTDVADVVADILREDGVQVLLDATTTQAEAAPDGTIRLTVEAGGTTQVVTGSHLLVAAGRTPNTDMLHLDAAGVATDGRGYVQVNDRLETSAARIYALGDVKGGPAFTHISYDDFRVVRDNLLGGEAGGEARTIGNRYVPYTVFIDPQLGRVGLSEREAQESGVDFVVAKLPMSRVARAIETGETRGFMKAVVDANTDQILGCAILGIEGGEVMAVLQMAMMGGVPYTTIRDSAFAHPTLAESLNNLFSVLPQESRSGAAGRQLRG